jgi:hypothetical protein
MKILLAPAETKKQGGNAPFYNKNNFYFSSIFPIRDKIVKEYEIFLEKSSIEELSKWFGIKNLTECKRYSKSTLTKPTMKAIQRYTGVAFDALQYDKLSLEAKQYCDTNVILFSNLFGALKADDLIPDYKFKQGANLPNIDVIHSYKQNIKAILDENLGDEIVDLRAGFYDKFYKPTAPTITYKFLKNGKVVSHWAKHYRGVLLKELAQNNITNFAQLMNLDISGLNLVEIQEKKNIKTLIVEIK